MRALGLVPPSFPAAALTLWLSLCPTARAEAPEDKVVEVEGVAAIVVDPATARDRALVDARRKALEEAGGVEVDARALYGMGLSREDWVRVRSFGVVRSSEILSEGQRGDRYEVRLRCRVRAPDPSSQTALSEFLSPRSFVVVGSGEGTDAVVGRLKAALLQRSLTVYDEAVPSGGGSPAAAGGRFLSDYVIRVESSVEPLGALLSIQAFQATARIQLTEISSGLLRAHVEKGGRVFGLSRAQALTGGRPDQFPRAVAAPAAEEFARELGKLADGGPRKVSVSLQAPSSREAFDRLAAAVRELRWVQDVQETTFGPEQARLALEYPEKVVYLAADLDYLPGYSVTSFGNGYVAVVEDGGR